MFQSTRDIAIINTKRKTPENASPISRLARRSFWSFNVTITGAYSSELEIYLELNFLAIVNALLSSYFLFLKYPKISPEPLFISNII